MEATLEIRKAEFYRAADDFNFEISPAFDKWLNDNGFFTAPASTKYHGVYEGGLFDHSCRVFHRLNDLTTKNELKWLLPRSPFVVGMFHDLCKCDQYIAITSDEYVSDGKRMLKPEVKILKYEYNPNTILKGHGSKSVILLSQFINLTEEEMLCIRYHMGPYEKEEWSEYDMAIRKYENVLWTAHADMLASKVDDI